MTLSGGQRQRLALARALYSRAELYVLDDIFSGLDHATAGHVARHAVYGMMREEGAAVLLVTHSLSLLHGCDVIVGMRRGATVARARVVGRRRSGEARGQQGGGEGRSEDVPHKAEEAEARRLVEEEGRQEGGVRLGVYSQYVSSVGVGVAAATLVVLLAMQLSANAFSFWLGEWARHPGRFSDRSFLTVSASIAGFNR